MFGSKPLHIIFDKVNGFIRIFGGIIYLVLFGPKNMMPFTIELDILLDKKCFFLVIMQKSKLIITILSL